VYQLCFEVRNWRDIYDAGQSCHCYEGRGGWTIDGMTLLILFLAVLAILALAAILEKTPDTHREVSQHGNFEF